jgi:hypothetical protein
VLDLKIRSDPRQTVRLDNRRVEILAALVPGREL